MSQHFDDLGSFIAHFATRELAVGEALHHKLEKIAVQIEKTAKSEIGTYQGEVGPFQAWDKLAEDTLEGWAGHPGKIELGYAPPDNPLLREGTLRDEISHSTQDLEALIGTPEAAKTAEIMVYHEFGTPKMPPRPVLGPAAFRNKDAIQRLSASALVSGLIGDDTIHDALGYNFKT